MSTSPNRTCINCDHFKRHVVGGIDLDYACKGQPGKKWPIRVAMKEDRCGVARLWFAPKGSAQQKEQWKLESAANQSGAFV